MFSLTQFVKHQNTTAYSFLSVFSILEVKAIMYFVVIMTLATSFVFSNPQYTESQQKSFIYGSMGGLLAIWPVTDLLTKGKYIYLCIVSSIALCLTLLFANICYNYANNNSSLDTKSPVCIMYGFLGSFYAVLVYNVLPLYITAKEREKHSYFEIPMAA